MEGQTLRGVQSGTRLRLDEKSVKTQLFARSRSVRGSVKCKEVHQFFKKLSSGTIRPLVRSRKKPIDVGNKGALPVHYPH